MICLVAIILSSLFTSASSNVMGIDFGSDTMKVAIVQPGLPLEIGDAYVSALHRPPAFIF